MPREHLRFQDFNSLNWDVKKVNEILDRVVKPVAVEDDTFYKQIGIRSHGKGIFHKELVSGKEIGKKRIFWIEKNLFIVNIVFAWESAIARTSIEEVGLVASHRFPMYKPKEGVADLNYLLHYFLTKRGNQLLQLASPGGAGRNKTLGQKEFEKLSFKLPSIFEQQKIADYLSTIDQKISLFEEKKTQLSLYKKAMMQKLFSQDIRFKDENGKDFGDWEEFKLGELLNYIQPTKYIVKSTEYNSRFKTPVLTAGKSFLLGYTDESENIFSSHPVIIFDDFTTAYKFVNFDFKVKSSAMKILKPKFEHINLKYVFEAMSMIDFPVSDHKRYWISEYQFNLIPYPSLPEQQKIADFLTAIDDIIDKVEEQVHQTKLFKKAMLQHMFV